MTGKNNHRGDSISKKMARFIWWYRVRAWLGADRFAGSRFCYLASFEGGDASVLTGMGIAQQQQLAVDFDPEAVRQFRAKYPNIPAWCGPLQDVAGNFDVIFADLCSNISVRSIEVIQAAARKVTGPGSVFGYAIQRGREARRTMDKITANRTAKIDNVENLDGPMLRAADGRADVVLEELDRATGRLCLAPLSIGKVVYQSVDPDELAAGKPGTPMLIQGYAFAESSSSAERTRIRGQHQADIEAIYWLLRKVSPMRREYEAAARKAREMRAQGWRLDSVDNDAGLTRHGGGPFADNTAAVFAAGVGFFTDFVGREHNGFLAEMIELAARNGFDPALCLNIPEGTVAALRAHRSRGSYAQQREMADDYNHQCLEAPPVKGATIVGTCL